MSVTWIEASAGTGKTYTLVRQVVERIVSGLPVDRILMVTFTEKATAELKTRIREGLRDEGKAHGDPRIAQALEDLPSLTITTIHGFCRALLTQFPLESGLSFEPELVDQGQRWRQRVREALRPRLADLDGALLAWAGLDDPEDLVEFAVKALNAGILAEPVAHPTGVERTQGEAWRSELDGGRGPLFEGLGPLKNLPSTAAEAFGSAPVEAFLHSRNHSSPYQKARSLGACGPGPALVPFLSTKSLEVLEKWDEGGSMWKKAAQFPLDGRLEAVRSAVLAWVAEVRHRESALPQGVGLGEFLRRSARYEVLERWVRPLADQVSDRELSFQDMIDRTRRLVSAEDSALARVAAGRWSTVLIDEFQDTDPAQWTIFSRLFFDEAHELVLVGDPKQSIYRFRGADLNTYRAVGDQVRAAGARVEVLQANFRSTAAVIESVNQLFAPGPGAPWERPEDFTPSTKGNKAIPELVGRSGDNWAPVAPLDHRAAASAREWNRVVAARALELLSGDFGLRDPDSGHFRPLTPGDLLVLVRSHREAWQIHRLLVARGIPSTVSGSGGLLASREAQEVWRFLQALERPQSLSAVSALAWTRPFAGASVDALAPALDAARADRDRGAFLAAFRRVAASLEPGVVDGGGLEAWLGRPGGARMVTNLEHVLELLQDRWHRGEVAPGKAALALETWIGSRLQEDEIDLRREGESPTLRLMTIHAAKGLEAPIVLHGWPSSPPTRAQDWYHHDRVDFLGTADTLAEEARRDQAEALRVRYVAYTRARCHQLSPVEGVTSISPGTDRWESPPELRPTVVPLGPAIPGLETRHPRVESHSGLWRRAQDAEGPDPTTWHPDRERREPDPPDAEPTLAGSLPAGPAFGDLVHDVLEASDWRRLDRELVAAHCLRARSNFGGRDLTKPLTDWLTQVLAHPVPLGDDQVVLAALDPADTRRELEFHLPLALSNPREVPWGRHRLMVRPGYLTGRIDLLFRHGGRLFLADWKTNRLAPGDDLAAVMAEAGYDLQAQWYWEALVRLCRLQGEPLEPGGVVYLFLRGAEGPRSVFLSPAELNGRRDLEALFREARNG